MKKIFFVVALLSMLFLGTTNVSALSVQDLQAQINALMQQIAQLQEQLKQMQGNSSETAWCHTFTKSLKIEDSGDEVYNLITALKKEGLGDELIYHAGTGLPSYFNESVASAVVEFQEKYASEILTPNGLKHGTGFVGGSTKKKLNALYGCGVIPPIACTQDAKQCPDGSYVSRVAPSCEFAKCPIIGKVKEQVKCVFNNSITEQKCYSADAGGSRFSCSGTSTCVMDVFGYKGEKIEWKSSCGGSGGITSTQIDGDSEYANFNCISQQVNQPPVISGISGPTALNVNETGKWTITASDPENGTLSYAVDWGETSAQASTEASANTFVQTSTLTHSYRYSGIFTIRFFVHDNVGNEAKSSITVNVGSSTQPSITVTSPNGGEQWKVGETHNITWTSNGLPVDAKIYANLLNYAPGSDLNAGTIFSNVFASAGSYSWTIPSYFNGSNFKFSLYKTDNTTIKDTGDNYFTITSPAITCTDSDGGKNYDVKGLTTNSKGDSMNDYCVSGYTSYNLMEGYCGPNGEVANTGHLCPGSCISGACSTQPAPTITITSPAGGETWQIGNTYNINWTSSGVDKVNIVSGSFASVQIAMNASASSGTYSWIIPATVTPGSYAITIYDVNNASSVVVTSQKINIVASDLGLLNIQNQLSAIAESIKKLFAR